MNIQVNELMWKPGENDAEYIKLLKRSNEEAHSLMLKATGKLAKMAKSKANEWISVEDRRPDMVGQYLIFVPPCYINVAFYNGFDWVIDEEEYCFEARDITHFMSLPEPPKE